MSKNIKGILIHLGMNLWSDRKYSKKMRFDKAVWNEVIEKCAECGLNTIVIDLAEGIKYNSHPEIAAEDAWGIEELKRELEKIRALGITPIPKLNFSTSHDAWLGEYARIVSTKIYYDVCRDLIFEAYELFNGPEYIHLGFDEEDSYHYKGHDYVCFRQGELLWHDFKYLYDCVKEAGSRVWIWADLFWEYTEDCKKHVPKDVLMSPWYYWAFDKDKYTRVDSAKYLIDYYNEHYNEKYVYVEDDPVSVKLRENIIPLTEAGYQIVPCSSNIYIRFNNEQIMKHCKENIDKSYVAGFMTATWSSTEKENKEKIIEAIELLASSEKEYIG